MESKSLKKENIITAIIFLAIGFVMACIVKPASDADDLQEAYDEGFAMGYDEGYGKARFDAEIRMMGNDWKGIW